MVEPHSPIAAEPDRIAAAIEALSVRPRDRVLEIGCGAGVAVAAVAERLRGGTIDAIDRSAAAVERASRRNASHIEAGTATIRRLELAELEASGARYDRVFAINVNLFWTRDAGLELDLLRDVLAPGGALHLFYDGAAAVARADEIEAKVVAALVRSGFAAERVDAPLLAIRSRPR